MKRLLTSPFNAISSSMHSHRAAQGVIYADMIHHAGHQIDIDFGNKAKYDDYDTLVIYNGNDWSGALNLFGGMKAFAGIDRIIELSRFRGEVISAAIELPNYFDLLYERYQKLDDPKSKWHQVDWDGLKTIQARAGWISLDQLNYYSSVFRQNLNMVRTQVIGDSHAISLYSHYVELNSVPFKTLHGALKEGLETFLIEPRRDGGLREVESYFGNIDIRHHLLRQENPEQAAMHLADQYTFQADQLVKKYGLDRWSIFEPLPIEDESRQVPKTGWYKGTPFYGSWAERNHIRGILSTGLQQMSLQYQNVEYIKWTDNLVNEDGQLDFKHMEKPRSIHLSRASYPFWTGEYWNDGNGSLLLKPQGIEGFFGE